MYTFGKHVYICLTYHSLVHGLLGDVSQKVEQVAHQGALTSIHMPYRR